MAFVRKKDITDKPPAADKPDPLLDPHSHDSLVRRAEKWLKNLNCKVAIRDPFKSHNREQPDAIGWRDSVSVLVEVKVSRSDFLADKKKYFRENPSEGMGDWRFYMCPPGVINVDDLPPGWGLLWVKPKSIVPVHGVPTNTQWHQYSNTANKIAETTLLVSALRRFANKGVLDEIY